MQGAIQVRGLTKRFGSRVAVDGIDLEVPGACAFGFLGPNGAGKTTLIRMLLGLTHATAGQISLLGIDLPAGRRRALAMTGAIIEEPRFHDHLTGRENLSVIAAVRGAGSAARIPSALAKVGLADRADERVKRYSLGMRQRLGVARCLLADPQLLILDEPTNGLDPAGIHEFREMIRGFVDEGRTVFLSSHLLDEVERICDRVAIVDHGKVVEHGSIAELRAGADHVLRVGCDRPDLARELLAGFDGVTAIADVDRELRLTVAPGERVAAAINRRLVEGGVEVHRIDPARASLEERFLEITSRLGAKP